MSAKLLEFKASERSTRGLVDTRVGASVDIEIGTSGSYKPFDADLEASGATSQQNTSQPSEFDSAAPSGNASATLDSGTFSSIGGIAGGRFQSTGEGGTSGKVEKHHRDSSSDSSSSSSSSDEEDKESAKAKRKKKKKRKGILSGSFLPKFGASKKSSKKDDGNKTPVEGGPRVTPPPGNVQERPRPSAEVQIQAAFDSSDEIAQNRNIQDDGSRPDVEIFSGIGADPQTNTGVTVTASSVDKFPAPEIRPVDDGTNVDTGLSAQLDGEYYDPSIESMDTTDLLSQIENTINSIEAAQQQQPDNTFSSELEINVDPTSSISANINPHSADIPAVDDLETDAHIHLPEPKDGPILELPEDAQMSVGSNFPDVEADGTFPDASLQISPERRSHSPSSSRSSGSENVAKSKNSFPSFKFHMPKLGSKKSPGKGEDPGNVSIDSAQEKNLDVSVSFQPDLVADATDVITRVGTSQIDVDPTLPDQKNDSSLDTSFNITDASETNVSLGGGLNVNAGFDSSKASLDKSVDLERDDDSDIDAYLGGNAGVVLPPTNEGHVDGKISLDAASKPTSKGKPKKGKIKMPKFRKFGSKKTDSGVDLPKVDAVKDMDVEKPDADSDIEVEISVSDGPSRHSFEVVGKRASLKRDINEPNIEMPVSQEVQLVVESKPQGDLEVSMPTVNGADQMHVGLVTPDVKQENGVHGSVGVIDSSVGLSLDGNVSGGVEVNRPESPTLNVGLNVGGASDVDDTSDIEAYLDHPRVTASPPAGTVEISMGIENADSSARVRVPYTKGKLSRKGNRNAPKFKSKPNFGGKSGTKTAGVHSPQVNLGSDVDVRGPFGDFEMDVQSPGADVSTRSLQTPKADVKTSVSEPNLVYDGETKRKGFTLPRLKMPKFKKKSRRSSKDKRASGSFDAEIAGSAPSSAKISASSSMPDISYGSKGKAELSGNVSPDFDGPSSPNYPHVDIDEKKKKRWSGSLKFPSFGLPKFGGRKKSQSGSEGHDISSEVDVTFNKPMGYDGNVDVFPVVDTEAKASKKDGSLEFPLAAGFDSKIEADVDIDKPGDKIRDRVNVDTDLPNIEGNIGFATIEGQRSGLPQPDLDPELEVSLKSAINPSAKIPSVQMQGVVDADDLDVNVTEDNLKLPQVIGDVGGGIDTPSGGLDVEIPKGKLEFDKGDYDGDVSTNVDGSICVPSGDFGIGGDISYPTNEVKVPGGEADNVDIRGSIDIPVVEIKMKGDGDDKSVSSSSSSSSSEGDEKRKKKGFLGSLHLPKFGGKGRAKKPKGQHIDDEELDDIAPKLHKPTGTTGMYVGGIDAGAKVTTPDISVSQKGGRPDLDVDIPSPEEELPNVSANIGVNVNMPSGDVVEDIPKSRIDVDVRDKDVEMDISGNIDGDIDLPRGDFDIAGDTHAPKGEVEVPSGNGNLEVGVGGNIDLPEVGIKWKGDGDDKSVSSSSSSSSSESGEKKKKGFFGSLHLPRFGGKGRTKKAIGTGVSFEQDNDVDGTLDQRQGNVDMDQGGANIGAKVTMPNMSIKSDKLKSGVDVEIAKPSVDLPDASGDIAGRVDLPSSELELNTPKGKYELDKGDHDVNVSGNVDIDLDFDGAKEDIGLTGDVHSPKSNIEAPNGDTDFDVRVGGNVQIPKVGMKVKSDGDDKSVTSSSSSSSAENDEKKKKKGFLGSLHLPKFGAKGRTRKPKGPGIDIEDRGNFAAALDKPTGTIDVDGAEIEPGAGIVTPEVSISQKEGKPDFDLDISKPDVELPDISGNIDGKVELPSVDLDVSKPDVELPDVSGKVDGKIELPSVDLDISKPDVDLTDISGNIGGKIELPSVDIEGDVPRGDVGIDAGDHDVNISGHVDRDVDLPTGDLDIAGGIQFPKGEVETPSGEVDLDVGVGGRLDIPEVRIKKKGNGDDKSISSSSSSSSLQSSEKKKKKGFFGSLHLPKFGGKGRTKKSIGTGVSFDDDEDVKIDVDKPQWSEDFDDRNVNIGADVEMPEMNIESKEMKPEIDVDVSRPDMSTPDLSGDLSVNLPEVNIESGIPTSGIVIDGGGLDSNMSGDVDGDINVPSGDIRIGGNIHAPSHDIEEPSGEMGIDVGVGGNVDMPKVGFKLKGDGDDKSVSSSSSSSSSESDDKKKKKGFFGSLHLPKFGGKGRTKKPKGPGVGIDVGADIDLGADIDAGAEIDAGADIDAGNDITLSLDKPTGTVDMKEGDIDVGVEIATPEVNVNQTDMKPNVDVDIPKPNTSFSGIPSDVDGKVNLPQGDVELDIPTNAVFVNRGDHDINISGNADGNIDVPSGDIDIGGSIHAPSHDIEQPSDDMGMDVGVGGNVDMPKVGFKLKGDGDDKSVSSSSSSSSSESNEKKKKKGFFGALHLPKFGGKGRTKKTKLLGADIGVGADIDDDIVLRLDKPTGTVDMDEGNIDVGVEIVTPEVNVSQKDLKPDIDVDISKPNISFPGISSDVGGKADLPEGDVDLNIPTSTVVIDGGDHDVNISGNIDGDIDVPSGDFGIGGSIHAPSHDIEEPSGEIEIDAGVGGNVDMPKVGFKLKGDGDNKSVSSSSSSSSSESDDKKKKKGFFGSLHLPKFGGKGQTKHPKGPGADIDVGADIDAGDDIALRLDKPTGTVNVDEGGIDAGADIVTPEVGVREKDMNTDIDVDISKANVDLPDLSGNIDGRMDVPSDELDAKIPKGEFDVDVGDQDVNISGNIDGSVELPRKDIDIGDDISAPRGEFDIPSGEVGLDVGVGGNIDMPEVGIGAKGDGDDESVSSSSSSSSSDVGEKKKKGFFGSLHLPKFGGKGRVKKNISTGVSFDKDGHVLVDGDKPKLDVDLDGGEVNIGAELEKPEMSVMSNDMEPGISVDISKPDINLPDVSSDIKGEVELPEPDFDMGMNKPDVKVPDVSINTGGNVELPSGNFERDIPTGKIDVAIGDQDVEIPGNIDGDIDLPRGDFDVAGDISVPKSDIEVPSGEAGIDVGVEGIVGMPEVGIKVKGDGDDKSVSSSSSSSSSEADEKKKKKGFFGSLHLPKFGGKGRTKKSIGTGVSFDRGDDVEVDIDKPQGDVDVYQGDIDIEADIVMPEVTVNQKDVKPDWDVDVSDLNLPDVSVGVDSRVTSLPSGDVEVSFPAGNIDIDTGKSGKVDEDFGVPRGGSGFGGDISVPRGDFEASSGQFDLDVGVGGNVDMPEVGIKTKGDGDDQSVTSSSSSGSDQKKKKKGFFGSLHLPKFGGKGHTKKLDTDVTLTHEGDPKRHDGEIDLDLGQSDAGINVDMPDINVGANDIKADVDLDVSKPNVVVPDVSGAVDASVELGKGDTEMDSSSNGIDIAVGRGDIEMPKGSLDLDKDVVVNLPEVDVHSPKPDADLSVDGEVKVEVGVGGDIDTDGKDISVGLPQFGVGIKGEGDDKSISSSSSSEEEKKEKKGLFGGLQLPKLGFRKRTKRKSGSLDQGDGVDVDLDDYVHVSADPSQADINPEVSVGAHTDQGDVDIPLPEVDPELDVPDVQVAAGIPSGGTDLKIDHGAPDVDLTIRGAPGLNDLKAEGDVGVPQEVGVDASGPEVNIEGSLKGPSIGMPNLDLNGGEIGSDKSRNVDVGVEEPSAEIASPGVNFGVDGKLDIGARSRSSSSSSSDDEEEKKTPTEKKKKGFLSFHLPKIHLKRPKSPEKKKGLSPANVEVELKTDVDVPDTNVTGAVVTGVDIEQPNVEFSGSEREVDLGPEVEEPEMGVSVVSSDRPKVNLSLLGGVSEPDLDINADVDVETDVDIGIDGSAKAGIDQDVAIPDIDVGVHGPNTANMGDDDDITFEKFGKILGEASFGDVDMGDSLEVNVDILEVNVEQDRDEEDQDENIEIEGEMPVCQVNKDVQADFDLSKQLGIEVAAEHGDDASQTPGDFKVGIGLSRSSSKSSVASSSSGEDVKPKKSKGFLPSLKFPKLTSGKGQGKVDAPTADVKGNIPVEVEAEANISPSVTVEVESAPTKVETKSPKGKLGFLKKGKGKKSDSPKSLRSDSEADVGPDAITPTVNVSLESTPPKLKAELEVPSASSTPGNLDLSGAIAAHSMSTTPQPTTPSTPHSFSVVVAIDFGTTFSGYAYSFTKEPDNIHVMRKWEGGDPGVVNMKTLTTLLLTPEGEFHSFGFSARDFYHDMNFTEAQKWLYFDKYKLTLHDDQNLNIETELVASNGTKVKALTVFTHTLKFFKDHFLEELMDLSTDDGPIDEGEIRWVLTVPAIWRQPAKQFMRQAAYQAGIASSLMPNQLLIALEPEAASIYIGKLSMKQLMPERMALKRERWLRGSMGKGNDPNMKVIDELKQGSRYLVVDCGGGTVDITVHEWEQDSGTLKELHKASGGTFGSINVDEAFINLLVDIFGSDFIEEFKIKRPAGWVDLLLAFEARKRNANPWKANYLNVSLPFSFIDYYKKFTNGNLTVDKTLTEYNSPDVSWCGEAPGMLRFSQEGMFKLFKPTTNKLLAKLDQVFEKPELGGISHIFLAGGFAESPLLQQEIREKYKDRLRVVIPQEVGLATLKGAVMYGQNPKAVSVRRTRLTYGVGALNKFNPRVHPAEKKIVKDGKEWCKDVFDVFVFADQSVTGGDIVTRSYAPASADQEAIKINIYCTEREDCLFITDEAVRKCGTLTIDLRGSYKGPKRRELQLSMQFGDTEVKVDALDVATGKKVEARVDFLNN